MKSCLICERIQQIKEGKNPYFVTELKSGYVVIGDHQYFKGYTLFLAKNHVTELHQMPKQEKLLFLEEMSLVSESCALAFDAEKLNIECLGNGDAHVHWHLFPRKEKDMPVKGPVWWLDPKEMFAKENEPSLVELTQMKDVLKQALDTVLSNQ